MIQAVFIDRDGTIGGGSEVEYPGDFTLFNNALLSIERLKKAGIKVLSFTNQPGIAKGIASAIDFERELLGFGFDDVYLCPHDPNHGCECRKPSPGMLREAARHHHLDLSKCVVIGDRWTDLLAAQEAGCYKILVKTGSGMDAFEKYRNSKYYGEWADVTPDAIAEDFVSAVEWIINKGAKDGYLTKREIKTK